jgi:DNA segregation ATPase FtsK/SpoIIIE, S-DNA-T family
MAQRSKSKKNQSGPASLKTEKDAKLTVSQVMRDERTHKITGAVFLLVSIFLFISFSSYLFTWREDQDKVFRGISILAPTHDVKVANLLGNLGAYISHFFFYKGFGLASYFICSFFFMTGSNWLFSRQYFSIRRNLRYVFIGLIYLSTTLAFVCRVAAFPWGGALGNMTSDWLVRFLGKIGTACVLSGDLTLNSNCPRSLRKIRTHRRFPRKILNLKPGQCFLSKNLLRGIKKIN